MEKTKQLHKEKSKIQEKVLSLALKNPRSFIAMCTGSGKTRVGVEYCKRLYKRADYPDYKGDTNFSILWVVPTEKLRDVTVMDEFYKWEAADLYDNRVETTCYASLKNYEDQSFDIVILDEAHRITPNNFEFFYKNDVNRILALSATPPHEEEKRDLLKEQGIEIIYHLSLDEGVKMGVVAPYKINVLYTPLNTVHNFEVKIGKTVYKTSELDRYKALSSKVEAISHRLRSLGGGNVQLKRQLKFAALARMRFIYNLPSKTYFAQELIRKIETNYPEERLLGFCGSIKQCETLFAPNTFHSKKKDDAFNLFLNEDINSLGVVKSVNEGHNIPNLDKAVIVQLDSNPRNTIQRIGRMVRKRPGHQAQIYIIVAKDTQDELWCEKALMDLDNINISHYDSTFLNELLIENNDK